MCFVSRTVRACVAFLLEFTELAKSVEMPRYSQQGPDTSPHRLSTHVQHLLSARSSLACCCLSLTADILVFKTSAHSSGSSLSLLLFNENFMQGSSMHLVLQDRIGWQAHHHLFVFILLVVLEKAPDLKQAVPRQLINVGQVLVFGVVRVHGNDLQTSGRPASLAAWQSPPRHSRCKETYFAKRVTFQRGARFKEGRIAKR